MAFSGVHCVIFPPTLFQRYFHESSDLLPCHSSMILIALLIAQIGRMTKEWDELEASLRSVTPSGSYAAFGMPPTCLRSVCGLNRLMGMICGGSACVECLTHDRPTVSSLALSRVILDFHESDCIGEHPARIITFFSRDCRFHSDDDAPIVHALLLFLSPSLPADMCSVARIMLV